MTAEYQKTPLRPKPKTSSISGETRYWSHFKNPVQTKHHNKITDIEFSPLDPYDFAVTSSTRVQIYDSLTCSVKKSLSRFPDVAYSGSYRGSDGKVLVAGCEDSKIRVYDLSSRVVLRTLVGHTAPVKAARFLSEPRFLLSGSDDHSVRTWDMTTEQNLDVLRGHTDYVRSVSEHTDFSAFCFLSGAYDHTIRYWDRRLSNRQGQACVFILQHGAPVEDVLVLPNHGQGDLLATAGGNQVQIWSLRMASSNPSQAGTRARIHAASNHQKTVLSLAYDYATDRMISGGLDHMIKIYDMRPSLSSGGAGGFGNDSEKEGASSSSSGALQSMFATEFMQVTHSMKFGGPILSTAISPDSRVLAVGMADGTLSIRTRDSEGKAALNAMVPPKNLRESLKEDVSYSTPLPPPRTAPRTGTRAYFGRGASFDPTTGEGSTGADDDEALEGADFRIARVRRAKLAPYDLMLKAFRYHAALDAALSTNRASVVVALLDELINRNALVIALSNREANSLLPLLHFVAKYLPHPSYASILIELTNLLLDLYAPLLGTVMEFDEVFYRLSNQVLKAEIETQKNCIGLQAFMDNISSRSEIKIEEEEEEEEEDVDATHRALAQAAKQHEAQEEEEEEDADQQQQSPDDEDEEMDDASEEEEPTKSKSTSNNANNKRKAPASSSSSSSSSESESEESEDAAPKRNGHSKPAAVTSSDSDAEEEAEEQAPPKKKQTSKSAPKSSPKVQPTPAPANGKQQSKKQKK